MDFVFLRANFFFKETEVPWALGETWVPQGDMGTPGRHGYPWGDMGTPGETWVPLWRQRLNKYEIQWTTPGTSAKTLISY